MAVEDNNIGEQLLPGFIIDELYLLNWLENLKNMRKRKVTNRDKHVQDMIIRYLQHLVKKENIGNPTERERIEKGVRELEEAENNIYKQMSGKVPPDLQLLDIILLKIDDLIFIVNSLRTRKGEDKE